MPGDEEGQKRKCAIDYTNVYKGEKGKEGEDPTGPWQVYFLDDLIVSEMTPSSLNQGPAQNAGPFTLATSADNLPASAILLIAVDLKKQGLS